MGQQQKVEWEKMKRLRQETDRFQDEYKYSETDGKRPKQMLTERQIKISEIDMN